MLAADGACPVLAALVRDGLRSYAWCSARSHVPILAGEAFSSESCLPPRVARELKSGGFRFRPPGR
eukprot:15163241-Alexandrium_andersonii.AAC.1